MVRSMRVDSDEVMKFDGNAAQPHISIVNVFFQILCKCW